MVEEKMTLSVSWVEAAMEYKSRCEAAEAELAAILHHTDGFALDGIQKTLDILRGETD